MELIEQRAPATCYRLETTEADLQAIAPNALIRMLALLHLIREFENRVLDLKETDLVHGPAHTSVGQEAVAAAVAVALRGDDMVGSTHRAHGHFLAKALEYYAPRDYEPLRDGLTPPMQRAVNRTLAEIMGLREGWCGGRGGSMHLYDGESGNLGSNAIVGGGIPLATGAAWAQRLQGTDRVVVSFFGDGAINQGCFHEVANMAALWGVPVLYLVENNLYAVGTHTAESSVVSDLALRALGYGFDSMIVDGMDPVAMYTAVRHVVEGMRRQSGPYLVEAKTYRHYHHAGRLAGSLFGYRSKGEEADWQMRDPLAAYPQTLLRHGIIAPGDNERLAAMARAAIEEATERYTEKKQDGARIIPAAHWPEPESAVRDVRCDDDAPVGITYREREDFTRFRKMTFVQAIAGATRHNMERDERVFVLGEEVANLRGGAYGATRGIKEVYPQRLINTPISETGFVGMAGGAASVGLRPIVEIMYPDFALMASDQLFNQIGKLRHMYGGRICFPLLVRTRVGIGFGYGGQHSMDPGGLFGLFSGWRVIAPSNAFDYIGLFNTAMRLNDPVLIIEHGMLYDREDQVPADTMDYYIPYGRARVVRPGRDVTVLTYMTGVAQCLRVADELEAEGISAEVIDLRTLDYSGMDYATIGESLRKTGAVVIVEQSPRSLSLSGRIADEIQERFFDDLDCPVGKITGLDVPPPVSKQLEAAVLPSLNDIRAAIEKGGRHML